MPDEILNYESPRPAKKHSFALARAYVALTIAILPAMLLVLAYVSVIPRDSVFVALASVFLTIVGFAITLANRPFGRNWDRHIRIVSCIALAISSLTMIGMVALAIWFMNFIHGLN